MVEVSIWLMVTGKWFLVSTKSRIPVGLISPHVTDDELIHGDGSVAILVQILEQLFSLIVSKAASANHLRSLGLLQHPTRPQKSWSL